MGQDADREQRLADALRANLRRRKAQQRDAAGDAAQMPAAPSPAAGDDPAP
jgi:hypothetical protein